MLSSRALLRKSEIRCDLCVDAIKSSANRAAKFFAVRLASASALWPRPMQSGLREVALFARVSSRRVIGRECTPLRVRSDAKRAACIDPVERDRTLCECTLRGGQTVRFDRATCTDALERDRTLRECTLRGGADGALGCRSIGQVVSRASPLARIWASESMSAWRMRA
jgi:hypothetical protein